MHKIFFFLISFIVITQSKAQVTTAINWTKEDCRTGTTIDLFEVLENNIVVIQEYIMTNCTPCINVGGVIEDMLADYESLYPGKVVGYQTGHDDYLTCDDMITWADSNDFTTTTLFNMGGDEIAYYGLMGMPTLLVLGGIDHKVFYYHLGLISTAVTQKELQQAIDSALVENGVTLITGIDNSTEIFDMINIYPNPAQNVLNIGYNGMDDEINVAVRDLTGSEILSIQLKTSASIDINKLSDGLYYISISDSMNRRFTSSFVKY